MHTREEQTKNELRYLITTDPFREMLLNVLKNIAISLAQIVDMMREGTYQ